MEIYFSWSSTRRFGLYHLKSRKNRNQGLVVTTMFTTKPCPVDLFTVCLKVCITNFPKNFKQYYKGNNLSDLTINSSDDILIFSETFEEHSEYQKILSQMCQWQYDKFRPSLQFVTEKK